jgi:hypothetical protein
MSKMCLATIKGVKMDLFSVAHDNVTIILSKPGVAIAGVVALLFLLFKRPKEFIYIVIFAMASAGIIHLFSKLLSLGLDHKSLPFIN